MSKLIDELDSLHELLNHPDEPPLSSPGGAQGDDASDSAPPAFIDAATAHPAAAGMAGAPQPAAPLPAVPVLSEVVAEDEPLPSKSISATMDDVMPSQDELLLLVDSLVERRLHRLKAEITTQVIEELRRIYPGLDL